MKTKNSPVLPVIGCLIIQLCVGVLYLWSVFRAAVGESYGGWSGVGMVASYMLLAFVSGNFVGGFISDKRGAKFTATIGVVLFALGIGLTAFVGPEAPWLMYITYCVMGGLGSGIAYGPCISCIQKWMPHRRGFATGLAVSAFGLSTVVFASVSKWLMDQFTDAVTGLVNFTPVFLILAGVFAVFGLIGCAMVSQPGEEYIASLKLPKTAAPSSQRQYPLGEAIRTLPFWCIFFTIFFINGTWNLTVPLIYDLGVERGLDAAMATFAVSFTGIPNAAGRLLMATVSDKIGRTTTMIILCIMTLIGAVCMIFIGGVGYVVTVAVIAFAYGGPSALNAAMSTDYFGSEHSGTNYGVIMMALGLSSVVFNWVSGNLLHGDVTLTFIMAAVTAVVPIFLMLVLNRRRKTWNS